MPRNLEHERRRLQAWLAERVEPCPACGYNLRGLTSLSCPECGSQLNPDAIIPDLTPVSAWHPWFLGRVGAMWSYYGITVVWWLIDRFLDHPGPWFGTRRIGVSLYTLINLSAFTWISFLVGAALFGYAGYTVRERRRFSPKDNGPNKRWTRIGWWAVVCNACVLLTGLLIAILF